MSDSVHFPRVIVADANGGWLSFGAPSYVLVAHRIDEVLDVINAANTVLEMGGYTAGFVCYEAAPAFDLAYETHAPRPVPPLAWFAVFDSPPQRFDLPSSDAHVVGRWHSRLGSTEYENSVKNIISQIVAGEVYQINLAYGLDAFFTGEPLSFFAELTVLQPSPNNFFAETEEWAVCSASPECFFQRKDGTLLSMPMKGTRPNLPGEMERLEKSSKDRAENLMIVDMLRNDMSRIPDASNVDVERLFTVECYPTVLQMTSTVRCETRAGLSEIFGAMFPCASITGAPKIAAMRQIRRLEPSPRGVYCGACGWAGEGVANFNVAIRTAFVDKSDGVVSYGVGSGVVFDSTAEGEWKECLFKTAILHASEQPPTLIETMRLENGTVNLLERHMCRLEHSSRELGFACDMAEVRKEIADTCRRQKTSVCLRLALSSDGTLVLTTSDLPEKPKSPINALFYNLPTFPDNVLLRHKTSRRYFYEEAARVAAAVDCEDAVLVNKRGEVTETCIANVVAKIDGALLTPSLPCGLLPGVARADLLDRGCLTEAVLLPEELREAEAVYRLNALRGLEELKLAP